MRVIWVFALLEAHRKNCGLEGIRGTTLPLNKLFVQHLRQFVDLGIDE